MKQIELDLEYLTNLAKLVGKLKVCNNYGTWLPEGRVVVAGGAIRDMLFNKPVSDIDVFYEGTLHEETLKGYFTNAKETNSVYPDGWNVTHTLMCDEFPVPVQLIQVKDVIKHIETFPSPMMRMYLDSDGIHGLDNGVFSDAKVKMFFWDYEVDLSYYLKIKDKYSDWKHEFLAQHYNPEVELVEIHLEF